MPEGKSLFDEGGVGGGAPPPEPEESEEVSTCPICEGTGKSPRDKRRKCATCEGAGKIPHAIDRDEEETEEELTEAENAPVPETKPQEIPDARPVQATVEDPVDAGAVATAAVDELMESDAMVPQSVTPLVDVAIASMEDATTPAAIEFLAKTLEARIDAEKRLRVVLLRKTNYRDWTKMSAKGIPDGLPYLCKTGCVKMNPTFDVEYKIAGDPLVEHRQDGTTVIYFFGTCCAHKLGERFIPIVGSRWSGDPWFTGKDGMKPWDPGDLMKAALSNFYQEGTKATLGLDSVTWEELKAAGIDITKIPGVQYGGKDDRGAGDGKGAPGDYADIAEGVHIKLFIPIEHNNARKKLKSSGNRWSWNNEPPHDWRVVLTKKSLGFCRDLCAEYGDIKMEMSGTDDPEKYVAENG